MDERTIKIPVEQSRYDILIKLEERINMVVDLIAHGSFVSNENVLRLLGTEDAIKYADELRAKDEAERAEYLNKLGDQLMVEE